MLKGYPDYQKINDFVFFPTVGMIHLQQDFQKKRDSVERVFLSSMLEEVGEQMVHCLPVCAFDRVVCEDDVQIRNVWVLFVAVYFHFVVQLKVKINY